MTLLNLTGRVCKTFGEGCLKETKTVQKIKESQARDVVTKLDLRLHTVSAEFIADCLPACKLLSEESELSGNELKKFLTGECLIVDPLDGSSNYALGIPTYGYMAAHIKAGYFSGVVVVLPEFDQYIVYEKNKSLYAKTLPTGNDWELAPVYYAYPPRLDESGRHSRMKLMNLIDDCSAGLYRYGSACVGLYRLLCGEHMAFIGQSLRIWDAIAFLPLLSELGFDVRYSCKGLNISVFASRSSSFLDDAAQILNENQGVKLSRYLQGEAVRFENT